MRKLRRKSEDNRPCSIDDVIRVSERVAHDVFHRLSSRKDHLHVAMSLHLDILREVVIESGLITEEKFHELYTKKAEEINRRQQEILNKAVVSDDSVPNMKVKVDDIEVVKE